MIVKDGGDLFLIRLVLFYISLSAIADTVGHKSMCQVIISLDDHVITAALTDFRIEGKCVVLEGGRHLTADCCLIFLKWFKLRRFILGGPITFLLDLLLLMIKFLALVQGLPGNLTCSILETTLFKFIFVFLKDML